MCSCWTRKAVGTATDPKIATNVIMSKFTSAINLLGHESKLTICMKANKAKAIHQVCEKVNGDKA